MKHAKGRELNCNYSCNILIWSKKPKSCVNIYTLCLKNIGVETDQIVYVMWRNNSGRKKKLYAYHKVCCHM